MSSSVQSILDSPSAQWHLPPNPPPSVPLALAPRRARRSGSGAGFGPNKRWRSISQLWIRKFHKSCIHWDKRIHSTIILVPKNDHFCIHVFMFSFYWWLLQTWHIRNIVFLLLLFDSVPRSEPGKVLDESQDLRKERVQPVRYRGMKCWTVQQPFWMAPYESFL